MKKIIDFLLTPWRKWKENREWKKRIKELQKRDPFIYK
jgi:hypothetical protein